MSDRNTVIKNGLSVDVEDYFHAEALSASVGREVWQTRDSRVVGNTHRVLDLLAKYNVRATFFVLGWVASRYPQLVRDIHGSGHELGCHSFMHRLVYRLSPTEFREDTRRAKETVESVAGTRILGYRAPSFSITEESLWALDILSELGFTYDSSIFPIRHDIYGIPNHPRFLHEHGRSDSKIFEFPMTTLRLFGMNFPFGGGGYLRLMPLAYTHIGFRVVNQTEQQPVIVYFHPWEIDPKQPYVAMGFRSRFRHYTNLHKTEARIGELLRHYRFAPLRDLLPPQAHVYNSSEVCGE